VRALTVGKLRGLRECSASGGTLSLLALDHRNNLRKVLRPEAPSEVNDAELGQGQTDTPFVVPAMGEAEFDMQFTANLATALSKFLGRKGSSETIDYRLRGDVALSSGFLRRIPFDERGSVKLK